jgi:predicted dinucleotide-utilizing enzyme
MKALIASLPILFMATAFADDPAAGGAAQAATHRYLIERSFPAGALDGLDAEAKARVNANNASAGVHWVKSFANADKTRTFCVYEGPSEDAIRKAAALNNLPVDSITEVPVDLVP